MMKMTKRWLQKISNVTIKPSQINFIFNDFFFIRGENVKLEIERLKKELKKSKKSSTSAQPSVDNGSEQVEGIES